MTIKKITSSDTFNTSDFNSLLDTGMVWDDEQGNIFLHNPDNALFVAFEGEQAIGFATAHRLQRFDKRQAEVLLYEIGVDEAFRRQGVGKALIIALKDWGKEVGADEVWVLTENNNQAAQALYVAAGGKRDTPDSTMFTFPL